MQTSNSPHARRAKLANLARMPRYHQQPPPKRLSYLQVAASCFELSRPIPILPQTQASNVLLGTMDVEDHVKHLLGQARQQFFDSLGSISPHYHAEFLPFGSGEELIQHIKKLSCVVKDSRRAGGRISKISSLIDQLQQYFVYVDVVVNVDPLHTSTIWGAIRLIFRWTSGIQASCPEDLRVAIAWLLIARIG